ncbi:MAG: ABC transporter permease [Methanocalculus sp.]|uniref:ABC transporter permease n=1 Tax=Methanocalculus sp. TaxID=2004547 RepID=UPI0027161F6C|nr:ABC transporter permease [Methanocalculus sp.]MDO8841910.1 ABC transporter permease [Methanocalculus sp.]MDO9540678.1 ABC transporter permease [Methanocalculus sp.]
MNILFYVTCFGAAVTIFLWLRDLRIYGRTGLPNYRRAALRGVIWTAVASAGIAAGWFGQSFVGIGLVLAALYMQGKDERERIWTGEKTLERFLGAVKTKKRQ